MIGTSDYEFDEVHFHIVMSYFEGRQVGIRVLDFFLLLLFVHVSYIFLNYMKRS